MAEKEKEKETASVPTPAPAKKKRKRLSKTIEGSVLTIVEGDTNTTMKFDIMTLPKEIQKLLAPFGASHKLGDSAAGKRGEEAVASINKVWDGLMAGNWSVRAPATEKISKKSVLGKFNEMPDGKEKSLAAELLKKLGIVTD